MVKSSGKLPPKRFRECDGGGFAAELGGLALKAMLFEIAATPKPGLVDRNNSGAHSDMDFFTFMLSAAAIAGELEGFALVGINTGGRLPGEAFEKLREHGRRAEEKMFAATKGINTHKGMIFTLGLILGAAGRLFGQKALTAKNICLECARLTSGLCERELGVGGAQKTHGEAVFAKYGAKGARGEAQSGFKSVTEVSLPVYSELMASGVETERALVQTLIHLIACSNDTNVLSRCGEEGAEYARSAAAEVLAAGGVFAKEAEKLLGGMDTEYIKRGISPGGCADLLAATCLLHQIEKIYGN